MSDRPIDARVTVVIPNWNGRHHLAACIESLRSQSFTDFEIVLVDNASTDGSQAWLAAHAPDVRLLQMPTNGGFSSAVNAGILASRSAYVALLNNDTAADPHWLGALVEELDRRPDFSVAASLMVFFHEPTKVNAAGDVFYFPWLSARNRGFGEPTSRYQEPCQTLGACAGAALYRRSFFDDVGLFDDRFFLLFEDEDLSLRALARGHRCVFVPRAVVRHKVSASIGTRDRDEIRLMGVRNSMACIVKSWPATLLPFAAVFALWRLVRMNVAVRPRFWRPFGETLRALRTHVAADLEGVRFGLAHRAAVRRRATASTWMMARWLLRGTAPL